MTYSGYTTVIQDGYVYVTTGTVSTNNIEHAEARDCVPIAVGGSIKHSIKKENAGAAIPVSKGSRTEKAPQRFIIDLKRITETINISGKLWNGIPTLGTTGLGLGTTTQTAKQYKENIRYIVGASSTYLRGGTFTIVWGLGNNREQYTVNSVSVDFDENTDSTDTGADRTVIPINIQFMIGTDR